MTAINIAGVVAVTDPDDLLVREVRTSYRWAWMVVAILCLGVSAAIMLQMSRKVTDKAVKAERAKWTQAVEQIETAHTRALQEAAAKVIAQNLHGPSFSGGPGM